MDLDADFYEDTKQSDEDTKQNDDDPLASLQDVTSTAYSSEYQRFQTYLQRENLNGISEETLLKYFNFQQTRGVLPAGLWSKFSMLRSNVLKIHNIDLDLFDGLKSFIKDKGSKRELAEKTFTKEQIRKFLTEASDSAHLLHKVVLILGICGGLKIIEMYRLEHSHVIDEPTRIRVMTKDRRSVYAGNNDDDAPDSEVSIYDKSDIPYAGIIRKYIALRPKSMDCKKFLISYNKGAISNFPMGNNAISAVTPIVARFLKLPNPESYTGRSLTGTCKALLSNRGAKLRKKNVSLVSLDPVESSNHSGGSLSGTCKTRSSNRGAKLRKKNVSPVSLDPEESSNHSGGSLSGTCKTRSSNRGAKLRKKNVSPVSLNSEENSNYSEVEEAVRKKASFKKKSVFQEEYISHPEVQDTKPEIVTDEGVTKNFELPGTSASQADIISSLQLVRPGQKQHVFINCVFNFKGN